jgi:uncharacterized protein YfiM (DUF2279 family)
VNRAKFETFYQRITAAIPPWKYIDKALHFTLSLAIGVGCALTVQNLPLLAWLLALVPGLAKEVFDTRAGGSGWSNGDLVADALGAAAGVYLVLQVAAL